MLTLQLLYVRPPASVTSMYVTLEFFCESAMGQTDKTTPVQNVNLQSDRYQSCPLPAEPIGRLIDPLNVAMTKGE